MIRSFIISALRNLYKNKLQSLIQIFSLALGLTIFILIVFYLYDSLMVDRLNPKLDQIYRLEARHAYKGYSDTFSYLVAGDLQESIPEIVKVCRTKFDDASADICVLDETGLLSRNTRLASYLFVDSTFLEIFPHEFIWGNAETALNDRSKIVLMEGVAIELFGVGNPLGETVYLWRSIPYTVSGVVKEPINTHLKYEAIVFWNSQKFVIPSANLKSAFAFARPTYLTLVPGADIGEVEQKIKTLWKETALQLSMGYDSLTVDITLNPLREVPYTEIDPCTNYMNRVNKKDLINFLFLGLGILVLGIINYVNLTVARSSLRSREISIRKINGSRRSGLLVYFLTESLISAFFSFLFAATLVQLLFPYFTTLLQADISLHFLRSPVAWMLSLLFILIIGIVAGLYPAIIMSSQSPLYMLSGGKGGRWMKMLLRRILMVLQFSASVVLLIAILSINHQINFMEKQDLGFDTEGLYYGNRGTGSSIQTWELLQKLKQMPGIESACSSQLVPGSGSDEITTLDDPESIFDGLQVRFFWGDISFIEVYGLKLKYGREILEQSFYRNLEYTPKDDSSASYCIINESCRKALDLDDPVGKAAGHNLYIVGVVEDFHFQSLRYPIKPLVMTIIPGDGFYISVKTNSSTPVETFRQVIREYEAIKMRDGLSPFVGGPIVFNNPIPSLEERFNRQYEEIERIRNASTYMAMLAVIIACLGLFGLSSFMVQRRTREIGIRKAMGSSESQVFWLLAKDFLKWVSLSLMIGLPAGWLIMRSWQKQFAYPAGFAWWIFGLTILIIFAVSFATVGQQANKTSHANPVDSLKTE